MRCYSCLKHKTNKELNINKTYCDECINTKFDTCECKHRKFKASLFCDKCFISKYFAREIVSNKKK
jgi:hypothetical protein